MKTNSNIPSGMNNSLKLLASAVSLFPCCLSIAYGGDPVATPTAEEPDPASNWVDVTVGGALIGGDEAAYKRRLGQGDFYGGISDMHLESTVGDLTWTLDGHAMFGNEDYELILGLVKDGLGYIEAGYSEFRTWYDGSGGYFPAGGPAGSFVELYDDELSLDRGRVWIEAGLRMEDIPEITLGYQHLWREGQKDSTIWGRTTTLNGDRAYVPSYYDIDEERDVFTLDVEHALAKTNLGLGLRYDSVSNDNKRVQKRQYLTASDRTITQDDVYESDLFSTHLYSETHFNERMLLSFGYAFTTLDTDFDGTERVYSLTTSNRDHGYYDMVGGSQMKLHAANASFWWNPVEDLVVVPSIKAEWEDTSALVSFIETARPIDPELDGRSSNDIDQNEFSQELEVRYSGFDNLLLYARGEWSQEDSDRWIREELGAADDSRVFDTESDSSKYTIGANWYPLRGLSLSAQYYYETMEQDFDYAVVDLAPMMNERSVDTHDINLRLTWRALPNLTFVTRYDYQQTDFEQDPYKAGLGNVESGEITRHILSESVTWNATSRLYVQGSAHWISDSTETGYNYTAAGQEYAPDWDNDYWCATVNAGYALTEKSTLEAGIFYYAADNYVNNQLASMPYGAIVDEYMLTLGYVQQISPNMVWNIRYGYYNSEDDAVGGNNDFDAHMVSTGLQVRF
jgi:hypothetical protein